MVVSVTSTKSDALDVKSYMFGSVDVGDVITDDDKTVVSSAVDVKGDVKGGVTIGEVEDTKGVKVMGGTGNRTSKYFFAEMKFVGLISPATMSL